LKPIELFLSAQMQTLLRGDRALYQMSPNYQTANTLQRDTTHTNRVSTKTHGSQRSKKHAAFPFGKALG